MTINSSLRISLSISLVLHLLVVALLFFIPQKEGFKERNSVIARLVSPEEMMERGDEDKVRKGEGLRGSHRKTKGQEKGLGIYRFKDLNQIKKEDQGIRDEKEIMRNYEKGIQGEEQAKKESGQKESGLDVPALPSKPYNSQSLQNRVPVTPHLPKGGLFDKEVVERLAKKEREINPDRGITFDTKELRYHSYMMRLKERIEGIWRYPPEAAAKGIYGDLYIRFTIKKDGRLGNVELLRTSGYRDLDDAALKALKDAEPFWPLPEEWKKDELFITGHFIYSLYGTYLR